MRLSSPSGMGLTILVAIIAILAIMIGASVAVFQNMARQTQLRVDQTKAHYLAQAGVMQAIWGWYLSDTAIEENRTYAENGASGTTVAGNNLFKFAEQGDGTALQSNFAYYSFDLSENATWATSAGLACTPGGMADSCTRLQQFRVRNIHPSLDITMTSCRISWEPDNGEAVTDIVVNGTTVYTDATGSLSGADIDIDDPTLSTGSAWGGDTTYFQWDTEPNSGGDVLVTVVWTFADDSETADSKSHEVVYWYGPKPSDGRPTQRTFHVNSTGQVDQNTDYYPKVLKTVKAVVSGTPGAGAIEIIDWDEGDKNIP